MRLVPARVAAADARAQIRSDLIPQRPVRNLDPVVDRVHSLDQALTVGPGPALACAFGGKRGGGPPNLVHPLPRRTQRVLANVPAQHARRELAQHLVAVVPAHRDVGARDEAVRCFRTYTRGPRWTDARRGRPSCSETRAGGGPGGGGPGRTLRRRRPQCRTAPAPLRRASAPPRGPQSPEARAAWCTQALHRSGTCLRAGNRVSGAPHPDAAAATDRDASRWLSRLRERSIAPPSPARRAAECPATSRTRRALAWPRTWASGGHKIGHSRAPRRTAPTADRLRLKPGPEPALRRLVPEPRRGEPRVSRAGMSSERSLDAALRAAAQRSQVPADDVGLDSVLKHVLSVVKVRGWRRARAQAAVGQGH